MTSPPAPAPRGQSEEASSPPQSPGSPLIVVVDFKQPQSYLALAPTLELAASCGVAIDWRPFVARPSARPSAPSPGDDRTARHLRFRALYFERDLRRYAEAAGLELGDVYRSPDSSVAGMGLLFAARALGRSGAGEYVARVFDGYWRGALDLEDVVALRGVLSALHADGAALEPDRLREDFERSVSELYQAGVVTAPAYVLGGEVFIGRAHLPMVRWLLAGKDGPPPI